MDAVRIKTLHARQPLRADVTARCSRPQLDEDDCAHQQAAGMFQHLMHSRCSGPAIPHRCRAAMNGQLMQRVGAYSQKRSLICPNVLVHIIVKLSYGTFRNDVGNT